MDLKILLLFLLYLTSSSFNFHQTRVFVAADQELVQKTCRNTLYYKLCMSSLRSDPTSLDVDTKGLAAIMVRIGVANATATSSFLSPQILSGATNTNLNKILKECSQKYAYAARSLEAAAEALAADTYDYAYMHTSAAADYPNVCRNIFRRFPGLAYPPKLARREDGLKHICGVVLGIIDLIGW